MGLPAFRHAFPRLWGAQGHTTASKGAAMTLSERIEKDYIAAYKAKDQLTLDVLRLLKTAAKNLLVELKRPAGSPGSTLSDAEMLDVLLRQSKQRQDSIEQYRNAGREDLAEREAAELRVLQGYLPKPVSGDEVPGIVDAAVREAGAQSMKDMGRVMNAIMAQYKGRIDGKALSAAVKARLSQA